MSNKALAKLKRMPSGTISSKRKGETPEGSVQATPTTSIESISQEREHLYSIDVPLDNQEIAALNVQEEDLIKLHPPRPTSGELAFQGDRKRVLVKKEPVASNAVDRQKSKKVRVLHPLPPGTVIPVSEQLTVTPPGPRFDKEGTFLSHSILGRADYFASELKQRKLISSATEFTRAPPIIEPKAPKPTNQVEMLSGKESATPPRERHALEHWTETMDLRREEQNQLAEKMNSFPENLAMNQGEAYRQFQEERMFIDRAIPALDEGKGYRVGSEFWKVQDRLGDDETGIHVTLTQTERGFPPEVEYIGVPSVVRKEKGIDMDSTRNATVPYTRRRKSSYFMDRRTELKETIVEVEHFRPDFSELQVIGHSTGTRVSGSTSTHSAMEPGFSRFRFRTDSLDSLGDEKSELEHNSDTTKKTEGEPPIGPALRVAGTYLQWMGPPLPPAPRAPELPQFRRETKSDTTLRGSAKWAPHQDRRSDSAKELTMPRQGSWVDATKCRVLLECSTGEIATSCLQMENCGSTAIYYSWESIAKPNPLGTVQAGNRQRFYFDTRGGILLPGEQLDFPFHFKSPNPGIFSEMWLLSTAPVLNKGKPLVVTLKGVASQEDLHKDRRDEIERILVHREAVAAAERILDRLVCSIRTPPRSPPHRETVVTEEDIFKEKNPEMYFHYNVVQQLRNLHDVALYPDFFQETSSLTPTSLTTKGERSGGGKKGEDKSGGAKRGGAGGGGAASKEKRGLKPKEEPEVVLGAVPEPPPELAKWDLSITSLLKIIMNVEEEASREDKLKQLNRLVDELSFPPLPAVKKSPYYTGYLCLCEAMDTLSDISTHLCQVMGLPPRDWADRGDKRGSGDDHNVLSVPGSPAHGRARGADKRTSILSKDKKEGKKGAKERTITPTHKKKNAKTTTSPRGNELNERISEAVSAVDVDPVLEQKYKENFYISVYRILEMAVEKMVILIESEKTD